MTPDDENTSATAGSILQSVADRLAALSLFASVPRSELEWLAARGEMREYAEGTIVIDKGMPVPDLLIVVEGQTSVYMDTGGAWRRAIQSRTGDAIGVLPYSRLQFAPGRLVMEERTALFAVPRERFPEMIGECRALTTALVHHLLDRTRSFNTGELDHDRLHSLAKLAAGLAHELNNPASAASRTASALEAIIDDIQHSARALAAARLDDAQLDAIDRARHACASPAAPRSALEQADREDDFTEWLERHGLDTSLAGTLAPSSIDVAMVDRLAAAIPASALGAALRWVTGGCAARDAARQLTAATGRMHQLVNAVKGFTFMDRESVPEEVDVAAGLATTVTMLESKARALSVDVRVETAHALPRIHGVGSELNQLWEKLIDNAIDAAGRDGHVTITATVRGENVVVRVADDGPGIPDAHKAHVFDPFFTTKPVGSGAGLGLGTARRVARAHHGDVDFTSQPGRTVFRVQLPVDRRR